MPTVRTLVFCIGLMSIMAGLGKCRIPFHKEACDRGTKCSQCPDGTYQPAVDEGGDPTTELLCCPGCANSTMFSSLLPGHPPCYCLISDLKNSRNFRFPETLNTENDLDASSSQDTNFILNKASKDPHAMHQAFGLIVAALENLDSRLTNIENRLGIPDSKLSSSRVPTQGVVGQGHDSEPAKEVASQGDGPEPAKEVAGQGDGPEPARKIASQGDDPDNAQEVKGQGDDSGPAQGEFLQTSGSTVNRLGEADSRPCPNANFTRAPNTGRCYYASVINNDRKDWEGALNSCQTMGATLAEPREALFWHVVDFLAKSDKTTGFGFWIGGIFLDSWLWVNSVEAVNLDNNFWAYKDNEDIIRPPGDIEGGRCLALRYVLEEKSYAYTADECGYVKYYLCEMLEKRHRLHF